MELAIAVKADRFEAGLPLTGSIPRWATSHLPGHINGSRSTGLATPQLFLPPPILLQASSSWMMSFYRSPSSPWRSIEEYSSTNRCRLGSTMTPLHSLALVEEIRSGTGCEHTCVGQSMATLQDSQGDLPTHLIEPGHATETRKGR
jgi:hypothetical protein